VTLELDQLSESITLLTEQLHENSRIIEKDAEIIRANSEIIKINAEAVKTDALSLTHELESEIGGIRSRIRILRDSLPELSTPQKDSFSEILSDAHRVIKTGQKLLEIAKAETIENGENSISIIGHTLTEVENRFRDPPLMIQFDCDQSIKVVMEQHRLISVIANLIDNAYTHGGHSVKIRVATDDLLGNCVIDVENEGTSISDYDSQQIFDRFFTGDRDAGHTGLGLNLVQTQLRTHKGDITLLRDSKLVTFRVTLPLMS
jgi:signal transduction histidine kinase